MSNLRRPTPPIAAAAALALLLAACSGGASSPAPAASDGGYGSPSSAPSVAPSVDPDALQYETGADDIVLRYDEGGGFMMASFVATMVPPFTLYGDGTIVFRDPTQEGPPAQGSIFKSPPMKTAKLNPEQIQDLLRLALDDGGLATAKLNYPNDMVADAGTAIFTITVGGQTKTVSVYALGMDTQGGVDDQARAAFLELAQTLTKIDEGGVVNATTFEPAGYRGILMESPGVVAPDIQAWPWPDIAVEDFKAPVDPNVFPMPKRVMTAEEIEVLGIDGYEGGFQNALLKADDGMVYTFSVRPLLPDETE